MIQQTLILMENVELYHIELGQSVVKQFYILNVDFSSIDQSRVLFYSIFCWFLFAENFRLKISTGTCLK